MSHVGGIPVTACNEAPAADDPRPQAGANAKVNEILQSLAGAKIILTQCTEVRILLDPDRKTLRDATRDLAGQVHFGPSEVDGVVDHAAVGIHLAGGTNPNAGDRPRALLREIQDLLCDSVKHGKRSCLCACGYLRRFHHLTTMGEKYRGDLCRAEINADGILHLDRGHEFL